MSTLSMKALKATPKRLEIEFSRDVSSVPLKGKHFGVHVFSPREDAPKEIDLPPDPKAQGAFLRFDLKEDFQSGALVIVTFSDSIAKEDAEALKKQADVDSLGLSVKWVVVGAPASVDDKPSPDVPTLAAFASYEPCADPDEIAMQRLEEAIDDYKGANANALNKCMTALLKAADCEDGRCAALQNFMHCVAEQGEADNSPEFSAVCGALGTLYRRWCKQDKLQNSLLQMMNYLHLAEEEFSSALAKESARGPRGNLGSNVAEANRAIGEQFAAAATICTELETCAQTETLVDTMDRLSHCQSESEEACCSLLCRFETFQMWCTEEYAEGLRAHIGRGVQYVARARVLLAHMAIDRSAPAKRLATRVTAILNYTTSLGRQVSALKPALEANCLASTRDSLDKMQALIPPLLELAPTFKSISAGTCAQVAQFRTSITQIEQYVGNLVCKKELNRCGIMETLTNISSITVQVFCFLAQVEKECEQLKKAQRATHAQPVPPVIQIVPSLSSSQSGAVFQLSSELSERWAASPNSIVKVLNATTNVVAGVMPATRSQTSVAVMADPGTPIEAQFITQGGEVVATAVAVAAPAPTA